MWGLILVVAGLVGIAVLMGWPFIWLLLMAIGIMGLGIHIPKRIRTIVIRPPQPSSLERKDR